MNEVSAKDLAAWLEDPKRKQPMLLDVRESWEFEICHIEGALMIPMNAIPEKLSEIDAGKPIVCICHHGVRSLTVALYLVEHGFSEVSNLTGGMHAWAEEVDDMMATY